MAGPRKSTILKKLTDIAQMLQNNRYTDPVKINKASEKTAKLIASINEAKKKEGTKKPTEYQLFLKAEMAKLKKSNPDLEFKELVKLTSTAWRAKNEGTSAPVKKAPGKKRKST